MKLLEKLQENEQLRERLRRPPNRLEQLRKQLEVLGYHFRIEPDGLAMSIRDMLAHHDISLIHNLSEVYGALMLIETKPIIHVKIHLKIGE
jgi:hypothetical protein